MHARMARPTGSVTQAPALDRAASRRPAAPAHTRADWPGITIAPPLGCVEQEADHVADQVMSGNTAVPQSMEPRTSAARSAASEPLHSSLRVSASSGKPLDSSARSFFEPRFGCDFSHVRVHADGEAAASARSLGARAYSAGGHIVFHHGEYAPHSASGRALLAHELTHVVQQSSVHSPIVHMKTTSQIARTPLDLTRLDRELSSIGPLSATEGEIGFGAARGAMTTTPTTDPTLPITAHVYQRSTSASAAAAAVRGSVPQATMERILRGMNLSSFQTNVAPSP